VEEPKKKRGAKPLIAGRSLTFAEAKQRQRLKDKALHDEMWNRGYLETRIYIHTKQLEKLSRLSFDAGLGQFDLTDTTNLSAYLFKLISKHLVEQGIVDNDLPTLSGHAAAQEAAAVTYTKLAKAHIESLKQGDSK
jgi:hypothetical protein